MKRYPNPLSSVFCPLSYYDQLGTVPMDQSGQLGTVPNKLIFENASG